MLLRIRYLNDVSNLVKKRDYDAHISHTKSELKAEQDKIVKRYTFDSSYFQGKSHFEDDITQNYLVFQLIYRYFKRIGNSVHISVGKSTGLSDESITPPAT